MPARAAQAAAASPAAAPAPGNTLQPSPAVRPHSTRRASTAASAAMSAAAAKAALIAPETGGGLTTSGAEGADTADEFRPGPGTGAAKSAETTTAAAKKKRAASGTPIAPGAALAGKVELKAEEADWGRQLAAKAAARMQEMKRQWLDGANVAPAGNETPAVEADKGSKATKAKKDKKGKGKAAAAVTVESADAALPTASTSAATPAVPPPAPESVADSTASNAEAKKLKRKKRKEERKAAQAAAAATTPLADAPASPAPAKAPAAAVPQSPAPAPAVKPAVSPSAAAAEGSASQPRRRKPKSERKKERREAEERAKAAQAIGSTHEDGAGHAPVAGGEVAQPVMTEAEKTDKGKGKAKEAEPSTAASPSKKSKKRKRVDSPEPATKQNKLLPAAEISAAAPSTPGPAPAPRKNKKRKVDAAVATAIRTDTTTHQSVVLHPASPRALAAASNATSTHPFAAFLPPFLHPHLGALLPATDAPQTAAFVEHVVDALYAGFGADVVDRALHRAKRQRVDGPVAPSLSASSIRAVDSPRVTEEEEADVEDNSNRAQQHASPARKRRASQLDALTDANAVAGPSGVAKQVAAAAPAPSPAPPTVVKPPPSSVPAAAPQAPASSPLRVPKPPPSSAIPAAIVASEQASSGPTSPRGSDGETEDRDGDVSMSQQSPGTSARRRSRVRPSKRERELMKRAVAEAHVEAAQESSDAFEQPRMQGDEDTQMIDETLEDDGVARDGTTGAAAAAAEATDSSVVAAEPAQTSAAAPQQKHLAAEQQDEAEDEELDQLDSTPAGTPPSARKAPNRAITRARESAASAGGVVDTPETSEDDEAEVQLSLQAHAAPASPGRRSPARRLRESPAAEEPEEARLPPSAQTPAKSAEQQEEDREHLAQAANTRLPSSSPEPALPTIGSRHDDDSSSDDSSDDSDSDDDDSSSGDDHPGGGFLTGAARRLQSATGGRQSLGMVARDAFGKSRRSSLARKKPTSLGSYNPSPLKNAAVAASSSSPTKGDQSAAVDDLDEIDQLLSQTQQSQRAARRTSGLNWAELEREEEELQKRKAKGKAIEDPSSEDDEADYQEAQEQLEGENQAEAVVEAVSADNDVDMAAVEAGEDASAVNGAPAEGGEPVTGSGAAVAPRIGVTGESAPITTALRDDGDAAEMPPSSQPEPAHGLAALEPALPTQEASQFPNGARLYPDLSTIGNLASSSQTGSPPVEVDPSQVVSEDEHDDAAQPEGDALPAESQFVPLQKEKPLFLETQTQADTQEPDTQFSEDQVMQVDEPKPSETLQAPLTPDASMPSSPVVSAPAIVEPAAPEKGDDAADSDVVSTPQAKSPLLAQQHLAPPATASGASTPARMTRAASARIASRSPSAEPAARRNVPAASQPATSSTPATRRKAAAVAPPLPTPSLANGMTPPAASLSLPPRGRASGLPSLSQLDSVKRPTRRSARVSSAAPSGMSASQPAVSNGRFLARESDEDQDSSDDDEVEPANGEAAGAEANGTSKRNGRLSMSQPTGGARGRARKGRQSDLWK